MQGASLGEIFHLKGGNKTENCKQGQYNKSTKGNKICEKKNGSKNQHQLLWKPISWHFITSLIQRILGAGHWCSLNSGFVLQKLGNQVLYWSCPAHGQEHGFHVSYLSYRLKNLIKRCLFQNSRRNNWQFCLSAKKALIYGALFFCCSSHFLVPSSLAEDQNLQNPSYKIQVQPAPISLDQKIQQESARFTSYFDTFNSTLFKTDLKESKKTWPALNWLFKTDIEEKRQQIKGSHQSAFESYWKIGLEGNLEEDKNNYTAILRTKLNVKVLIQLSQVFFAKAEFELLTSTGSIQKIYQRSGETNGISQRRCCFYGEPLTGLQWSLVLSIRGFTSPFAFSRHSFSFCGGKY